MAELNGKKIYEILNTIDSKVDQLLIWKAEHVKAHELVERDVGDSRAALFENPGLISKVNVLWNYKSDTTKWRKFWLEILKYLVVASIVGIVTWLLLLYKGS